MKRKKILALLMVAALCVGTVAGCGSKDTESSKSESSKNENSESSTGDSKDDLSPITFKYYNADGKNGNWENPVAQAITEATGVTLDISYPVSSTGDPDEDISLMIAEDKYPDMIYAKQSVNSLYEAGALIDMTDLIEEYGPNIKKMYGDEFEKLKWGSGDEGIYQLSYAGVGYQILATGGNCQIQYAALKENNYEYPKTLEEYEALIKQYLAAHPKTDDGLDTIGISMSAADWHWLITLSNPAGFIADGAPDNGSWLVDDNYNCIYKHVSDKEKEYFRWLSRMYDEGILDPNFATQKSGIVSVSWPSVWQRLHPQMNLWLIWFSFTKISEWENWDFTRHFVLRIQERTLRLSRLPTFRMCAFLILSATKFQSRS